MSDSQVAGNPETLFKPSEEMSATTGTQLSVKKTGKSQKLDNRGERMVAKFLVDTPKLR